MRGFHCSGYMAILKYHVCSSHMNIGIRKNEHYSLRKLYELIYRPKLTLSIAPIIYLWVYRVQGNRFYWSVTSKWNPTTVKFELMWCTDDFGVCVYQYSKLKEYTCRSYNHSSAAESPVLGSVCCHILHPDATDTCHFIYTRRNNRCAITTTSNDHQYISIHLPLDCLFRCLFILTSKETLKLCITGLLWRESTSTGDRWVSPPIIRKVFPFHDVIMNSCNGVILLIYAWQGRVRIMET